MDARDEQGLRAIDKFYEEIVEIYPELRDVVGLREDISAIIQDALAAAQSEEG